MKLAICLPSRGLIHSRTIQHLWDELKTGVAQYEIFITHDLPIPECFNHLTKQALAWGADKLWFIEEDMQFPKCTLQKLLDADTPVSTINYPVSEKYDVVDIENGVINKIATGCTLIDAEVFEKVGEWRSDIRYSLPDWTPFETNQIGYGQHDVHFTQRCKQEGIEISIVGEGNQYRVKQLGQERINVGFHDIRTLK